MEDLHRATSVLDDMPISVAQKIKQKEEQRPSDRSTRRKLDAENSLIRATVASSSAVNPPLTSIRLKRDFYETAFKSTQEHLKKMKTKLEKKEALAVMPVRDCEISEEAENPKCRTVPILHTVRFQMIQMRRRHPWILRSPRSTCLLCPMCMYDDQGNSHEVSHDMYVVDMLRECHPIHADYDALEAGWPPDGERRIGIRRRNPTPCIRARVSG